MPTGLESWYDFQICFLVLEHSLASIITCKFYFSRPHRVKIFYIFCVLDRQQLVERSVVEPTWLPSSTQEASLCGNEQLNDLQKESGQKGEMQKNLNLLVINSKALES